MLTVTAATGAVPVNNFALTISANAVAHPLPIGQVRNTTLSLTVTATPDYALAISNSPQTTTVLGQAVFNGTLTAANSFNSPVTLSCGTGKPSTCTIAPNPVTPTGTFTVTTANATPGVFNFNVSGTGGGITHAMPVALTVNADYHITTTTASATVTAGNPATYMIDFGPDGQATFANDVTYTCSTPANLTTCSISPATLLAGTGAMTVTMTVTTTATTMTRLAPPAAPWKPSGPLFAFWLSLPAMGIVAIGARRGSGRRPGSRWLAMLSGGFLLLMLIGSLGGCSGSSHHTTPGTTPGTYTVTINATSGTVTHMATTQLTVQ
jgi:hypothetical protein